MENDVARLVKAMRFAAEKHRDQRRKDSLATPYINHPIELAELLVNQGRVSDMNTIIAAILHDTVEDTDTSEAELVEEFGELIAAIVMEVTDDKAIEKMERKRLQVVHAAGCSDAAKLVKLADKICNLRDLERNTPVGWTEQRQQEYYDWARSVIDQLRGIHPVLEELFDQAYANRPGPAADIG